MNSEFWQGRRVLVTGHTGFKGSWLCMWLRELGADVYGYALEPPTSPSLFHVADTAELVNGTVGDVCDLVKLTRTVEACEPDNIIHMAAQSVVLDSYENPVFTYATNVMGTVNLLEAVRKCGRGATIVNVTTDKCYENTGRETGYKESDRLGGHDPYSNSKACSELVSAAYRSSYFPPETIQDHGVAVATARAGNVVGGGDWTPWQLVPEVIESLSKSEKVVLRHPDATRPWQHVLDCLAGYLTLAEHLSGDPLRLSGEWNFGPNEGEVATVAEVVETMAGYWGVDDPWVRDNREHSHEAATLSLDSTKANTELKWTPRLTTDNALQWVVEWYRGFLSSGSARDLCRSQIKSYMTL